MHSHPEKYTKPANLSYKIMQLRSGTVLSSPATSRRANTNTRDPDYVVSKVELAKFKVREQVRERQRKIAEPHVNKAVENFAGMMQVMINEFHDIENETNVDPFMNKIRMITSMFAYANSRLSFIIMSPKMMRLRGTMLKQCKKFSQDAQAQVQKRIEAALSCPVIAADPKRNPKYIREYYMHNLIAMQAELDQFTATYANRL